MSAPGGCLGAPSMENDKGESESSRGLGSETVMLADTAVRPLARCEERGIFAPAIRNCADGAASRTGANCGKTVTIAASTSSRLVQTSPPSHRQLARIESDGVIARKNRWARPSLLINVPSDSANVPAGSTSSALGDTALKR